MRREIILAPGAAAAFRRLVLINRGETTVQKRSPSHASPVGHRPSTFWVGFVVLLALWVTAGIGQKAAAQSGSTLSIYLARHGQTDWNVEGRTQGGTDTPLNATGRAQATQLKTRLTGVQFDAVYSSTLGRSLETGEIARGTVPLSRLAGLSERRFGKFEGRLTSDPEMGPEFERRRWTPEDSLDGGESLNAFTVRVRAALETIQREHPSGTVLVVGHGNTNQVLLGVLFGLTIDQMRSFRQENDELYLIQIQAGTTPRLWKLITKDNLKEL